MRIVQVKAASLYCRSVPFNGAVPDRQLAISLTVYTTTILGGIGGNITEIIPFDAFTQIYATTVSIRCIMGDTRGACLGIVYGYFCSGCYIHTATVSGCFISADCLGGNPAFAPGYIDTATISGCFIIVDRGGGNVTVAVRHIDTAAVSFCRIFVNRTINITFASGYIHTAAIAIMIVCGVV